ncbi:hypothetical protein FH581_014140 [Leptospira weilii]|uniref:hypothetical protein n=1 Tax=Leptospira weilii TaxID=28184 RepID=UPI00201B4DF1|nr:hypothetical protein [Leptospira weilii]UPY77070.1 hypothetical protein FH581_014140 [Leptospira weilii]
MRPVLRQSFDIDWELDDGTWVKVKPRPNRSFKHIPNACNDKCYSRQKMKSWKELRKTQYHLKAKNINTKEDEFGFD